MSYIYLFLFMLVSLIPGAARAIDCAQAEEPSVSVHSIIEATKFVRSSSINDLTKIHNNLRKGNQQVLGTGGGQIGVEGDLRFSILTQGNEACISLQQISARYTSYPEIHIASNFEKDGCEYRAVLAHEQKHIEALAAFHREYYPKLRKELEKLAGQIKVVGPVASGDVEKAQKQMSAQIFRTIDSFTDKAASVLEKRQAEIDTAEEYEAISKLCKK